MQARIAATFVNIYYKKHPLNICKAVLEAHSPTGVVINNSIFSESMGTMLKIFSG